MIHLSNRQARRIALYTAGLAVRPSGDARHESILSTLEALGMVQLDTLNIVSRAHHHILWSRHGGYRPTMYDTLLERRRSAFEHFTHDAALLPMSLYPYWQRQFQRKAIAYEKGTWGRNLPSVEERQKMLEQIAHQGPVRSRDFEGKADKSLHAWMRPPHKLALDCMWLSGQLAISHRRNFHKYYDLTERVIPSQVRPPVGSDAEQLDWLCRAALQRLGFATVGQIQRFWDAADHAEVRAWADTLADERVDVQILNSAGIGQHAMMLELTVQELQNLSPSTSRLRVLSPFDPLVRDRRRLQDLFGFDFRIEIYTPSAKRRYGYYVYPILEGERFTGRIELKADREADCLAVPGLWLEPGVKFSAARQTRLERELHRLARLAGVGPPRSIPPPQQS